MKKDEAHYITPDQLRIGLYIHLELSWMDHPFPFSNFKIKNEAQIAQIKALGLKRLRYDPQRSDCEPAALPVSTTTSTASDATPDEPANASIPLPPQQPGAHLAQFRASRLQALHASVHECEQQFLQASSTVKRLEREILERPPKALGEARVFIDHIVESMLTEGDIALHAMQPTLGNTEQYVHPLNVMILALILAKNLDLSAEDTKQLALGCLFHDIGKAEVPDRVLMKMKVEPLTRAEIALLQQHAELGAKFAREHEIDGEAVRVIEEHHEHADGTGYPRHLKGESISPLARIAALVNAYDNLCNPPDPNRAMTPYEALSHIFSRQRAKFDHTVLKMMIKCLGVYPPGSIVQLSDNRYGLVASVNPTKPLRPYVLLYAPEVPREEGLLINLGDMPGVTIARCLRQEQLPRDVLAYLAPGRRICYFFRHDVEPPLPAP